jgi:hypothetical protein
MSPIFHNIGKPGESVRMTIHHDPNGPADQLQDGEVIVTTVSAPTTRMVISADGTSLADYVPALDEAKRSVWDRVKGYRTWAQNGGCDTPHGRVQTEGDALDNIHRAALAAVIDPAKVTTWTMLDNSRVDLTADEMIAMSKAVQLRHEACQAKAQGYRDLIFAATDQASLDAIDVRQDWPD